MLAKSPNRIVMQFCTWVNIRDVVTPANFGSHWFQAFSDRGIRISGFYRASICEGGLGSRNSVCPSVCHTHGLWQKTKWCTAVILIPHKSAITLLLWQPQWLVGNAPFPLKSALKVTHPLRKTPIFAHNVSIIGDSEKKFNYDEYKVDHGLSNEP